MEFALGMITFWATNQALVTLRKWKSYPASFSKHNAIQLEINKKKIAKNHTHKDMEAKQHATKQPMEHRRNQRGKL